MQFGLMSVSDLTTDPTTGRTPTEAERIANSIQCRILSRELVHARMRLADFSPPGIRQTWEIA